MLKLIKKDCTIGMAEIKTAYVDLVLTSPPYWNIVDYGHDDQLGIGLTYKQYFQYLKMCLSECARVVKEDSFLIIIVGDIRLKAGYRSKEDRPRILSLHADIIKYLDDLGMDFSQHFIWKHFVKKGKKGGVFYGSRYGEYGFPPFLYTDLLMEHVLVFRKPGERRNLFSNKKRTDGIHKDILNEWLDPIWEIDSPRDSKHPATFPKELIKRLITLYSLQGDTVLDPFLGSGTTFYQALELGRNAIGYENNDNYVKNLVDTFGLHEEAKNVFKGI